MCRWNHAPRFRLMCRWKRPTFDRLAFMVNNSRERNLEDRLGKTPGTLPARTLQPRYRGRLRGALQLKHLVILPVFEQDPRNPFLP